MIRRSLPRLCLLSCLVLLASAANLYGQPFYGQQALPLLSPSAVEFRVVTFGGNEEEAAKKLNDLAAEGWQYVGPLGNSMVAFKRERAASLAIKVEPDAAAIHRVSSLGDRVWTLDMSPDGKFCVAAVGNEALDGMKVRLYDMHTGAMVRSLADGVRDYVVRFANGGKWIVQANYDGTIWVTDTGSGQEVRRFRADVPVWDVHVVGGGMYAVVTSPSQVQIRNLDTGDEIRRWRHSPENFVWRASADGQYLYYTVDGSLPFRVLNLETNDHEPILPDRLKDKKAFTFLPDGRHLVKDGSIATVIDTATGAELKRIDVSKYVQSAIDWELLRDQRCVWVRNEDHSIAVWDIATGQELCRLQADSSIRTWRISPDNRHAVIGTTAGTLYFWQLPQVPELASAASTEG